MTNGPTQRRLHQPFRLPIQVPTAAVVWVAMLLFLMECERGIIFDPLVDSPDGHHPD